MNDFPMALALEQVHIDSCAFDPKNPPEEQEAALKIFEMGDKGFLDIGIAYSTEKEIEHPKTPMWVKQKALELIYTVEVGLNEYEKRLLAEIGRVLVRNGKSRNHKNDAKHIFEAQKYGAHFITTDDRVLRKASQLQNLCSIRVFKPSEFLIFIMQFDEIASPKGGSQ